MEPYRHKSHPQVDIDGIEVDEAMRDLLVVLWKLGLDTQYSCQRHRDRFGLYQSYSRGYASQIVFGHVEHAFKLLKKSAELIGHAHHGEDGFLLHTMRLFEGGIPRAEATFSPRLLPGLTQFWIEFETTVPQASASPEPGEPRKWGQSLPAL